jgi:hypothetical protein
VSSPCACARLASATSFCIRIACSIPTCASRSGLPWARLPSQLPYEPVQLIDDGIFCVGGCMKEAPGGVRAPQTSPTLCRALDAVTDAALTSTAPLTNYW